jgi:hypothetical protein
MHQASIAGFVATTGIAPLAFASAVRTRRKQSVRDRLIGRLIAECFSGVDKIEVRLGITASSSQTERFRGRSLRSYRLAAQRRRSTREQKAICSGHPVAKMVAKSSGVSFKTKMMKA